MTPDQFAADVIKAHVKTSLKGRLVAIDKRHRPDTSGGITI